MERQQRLTEEFVPRADMVLFVLSADRWGAWWARAVGVCAVCGPCSLLNLLRQPTHASPSSTPTSNPSPQRPLTDSELTFLRYIRQWRKKVVFVVNKVDLLETQDEVDQLLGGWRLCRARV